MSDTRYTGTKMSIDFLNGDLLDVFKLFADVSGLNVVVNPGISGRSSPRRPGSRCRITPFITSTRFAG